MSGENFYRKLKELIKNNQKLKKEYPETYYTVKNLYEFMCYDKYNQLEVINELCGADPLKKHMHPAISEFVKGWFAKRIKKGDRELACNLGALYYTGRCGEQNFKKAMKYYKIAADAGCDQAIENLGYCYYYGRNGEVNYKLAFKYYSLGAFKGRICSLFKIGDMYKNGYYVQKDLTQAFSIYEYCYKMLDDKLIPLAGADVTMRLGDCYCKGIGTKKDLEFALKLYQESGRLYFKRLKNGEFFYRGCYDHVIKKQLQILEELENMLI